MFEEHLSELGEKFYVVTYLSHCILTPVEKSLSKSGRSIKQTVKIQ